MAVSRGFIRCIVCVWVWMAASAASTASASSAVSAGSVASAQEPPKREVRLRFDEAQREEIADPARAALPAEADTTGRFACKLNRRRVPFEKAYDAVTLWNVKRVKIKNRRMRLTDTTRRERVRLLKFFTERDRRKGVRPHLLGNVAGYTWSEGRYDPEARKWLKTARHIASYTLRSEYDSVRRAGGEVSLTRVPDELWHDLPPEAVYELNGERVPGGLFQFIDGLILRTLEIHTGPAANARYETRHGVVVGDTYPDRVPIVIFCGNMSTIESWLKMCHVDAFSTEASAPMHYYYVLPAEAVQLYGTRGRYGAICIEPVD